MGPTWVLSAPDGPHVGPMNFAIRDCIRLCFFRMSVLLSLDDLIILNITILSYISTSYHFPQNMTVWNSQCSLRVFLIPSIDISFDDIYLLSLPKYRLFHSLHWRHNGRDNVSNHQPHSSPSLASNAENISIWWRHHVSLKSYPYFIGVTTAWLLRHAMTYLKCERGF